MSHDHRSRALISKCIEGSAIDPELEELRELFFRDESIADEFAQEMRIHVMLSDSSDQQSSPARSQAAQEIRDTAIGGSNRENWGHKKGLSLNSRKWIRPSWVVANAVISAFLIAGVSVVLVLNRFHQLGPVAATISADDESAAELPSSIQDAVRVPVAVIRSLIGTRFSQADFVPNVGDQFYTGVYCLSAGIIQLEFMHNPKIIMEAPCEFEIKNRDLIVLHHGRVSAKVPEGSGDFTIETPNAMVIDKGTEFAVEVDDRHASEVHVFDGTVSVASKLAKVTDDPAILHGKKASLVEMKSASPSGIDVDSDRFLRSLEEPYSEYYLRVLNWNPALYYRMNAHGGVLRDAGPLGIDATVVRGEARGTPWGAGKIGMAFQLGGPSCKDYAVVPDYPKTTNGTLSGVAWVFAKSRPRSGTIAKNWAGDEHGQFHFGLHIDEGDIEIYISDGEGREVFARERTPLPIGQWQHVAFVADGSLLRLYRNGAEVAATPYAGIGGDPRLKVMGIGVKLNPEGNQPDILRFKNDDPKISDYWHGRIDDLALFNHPLSAEQIRSLYECSK